MGLCSSTASDGADNEMNQIDLELMEQELKALFNFKILLLGAGESGKSTVVKQIALIHKKKLEAEELDLVATSLHQNVIDCFKSILVATKAFGIEMSDEDSKMDAMIRDHPENKRLSPEQGESIILLWNGDAVQQTFARRNEFWLLDSFPYYVKNLTRFCEEGFVPTEEDAVMARIRTTGIVVTEIESKLPERTAPEEPDQLTFQVVDVGGQRNERKKWIHCFDDVAAIMFIVNLAGYNQVMFEDQAKNRMEEELELFKKISTDRIFGDTPIFLFFNKLDLFTEMIKEKDMKHIFPEYDAGNDPEAALEFVKTTFQKQCPKKQVTIEVITASSDEHMRRAFENVKQTLYRRKRDQLLERVQVIKSRFDEDKKGKKGKDRSRV